MGADYHNTIGILEAETKGYRYADYPYQDEFIPMGTYAAVLDFKIWAKRTPAINCCFTHVSTKKKFQITVYRLKNDDYKLLNCDIDFVTCPTNATYEITIDYNSKGKIKFKEAKPLNLTHKPL